MHCTASSSFNLLYIRTEDEWKTDFRTRYRHFEYLVMPFCQINAPTTFQHFVNEVFRDILDQYVVIYLNDILVFSNNSEQHCYHICSILERLWKQSLYMKLEKCTFDQYFTEYLGYILSPEGIKMNPPEVEGHPQLGSAQILLGITVLPGLCKFLPAIHSWLLKANSPHNKSSL
ncbi:unnamed protein product [Natator depressus]